MAVGAEVCEPSVQEYSRNEGLWLFCGALTLWSIARWGEEGLGVPGSHEETIIGFFTSSVASAYLTPHGNVWDLKIYLTQSGNNVRGAFKF